jgi:hypothetical protein
VSKQTAGAMSVGSVFWTIGIGRPPFVLLFAHFGRWCTNLTCVNFVFAGSVRSLLVAGLGYMYVCMTFWQEVSRG